MAGVVRYGVRSKKYGLKPKNAEYVTSPTNRSTVLSKRPNPAPRIELNHKKDDGEDSRCSTRSLCPLSFPTSSAPSCGQVIPQAQSSEVTDEKERDIDNGEDTNTDDKEDMRSDNEEETNACEEESEQNNTSNFHTEEANHTEVDKEGHEAYRYGVSDQGTGIFHPFKSFRQLNKQFESGLIR